MAVTRRLAIAALVVLLCAGSSLSAQTQTETPTRTQWLMRPVPPLPPLGLQTADTGGQPVTGSGGHPVTRPPQFPAPSPPSARASRGVYPAPYWGVPFYPTMLVVVPYAVPATVAGSGAANRTKSRRDEAARLGLLSLDIQPAELLQIFVDGYYVGTTADVGSAIDLEPGPHRIELRAQGFEPLDFGVSVRAGRVTTYRDTLRRQARSTVDESAAAAPATPPASPMPLFVIPGCYAGNTPPPDNAILPPGCDRARMTRVER